METSSGTSYLDLLQASWSIAQESLAVSQDTDLPSFYN